MNVKDLAVIVTGGGTGIGFAAAKLLKEKGAKVSIFGRRKDVLEEAAKKIGALAIPCDISDEKSTEAAFKQANEAHGPVRILVNSAAVSPQNRPVVDEVGPVALSWFTDIIAINLSGIFNTIRLAAAEMRDANELDDSSRGVIINISSVSGHDGPTDNSAYVAAKGGINSLTLALAREFGQFGVRVMTISPGPVDTELSRVSVPQAMWDALPHVMPFPKRAADPAEVAQTVLHICEQTYLNGEIIRFDGGYRVPFRT